MVIQCNCKNCAAPLPQANQFSKCDYCGSDFRVTAVPDIAKYKQGGDTSKKSFDSLSRRNKILVILGVILFPFVTFHYMRKAT